MKNIIISILMFFSFNIAHSQSFGSFLGVFLGESQTEAMKTLSAYRGEWTGNLYKFENVQLGNVTFHYITITFNNGVLTNGRFTHRVHFEPYDANNAMPKIQSVYSQALSQYISKYGNPSSSSSISDSWFQGNKIINLSFDQRTFPHGAGDYYVEVEYKLGSNNYNNF